MANSNGWGDGSANNNIGWGQGAVNNNISWGKFQINSWSGATDIDGGNPPVNSVAPALSGTAQEGQTLTCSTGTWSGTPTYTYQWKRNGSNIGSATNSTYVLVTADVGQSIKCTVTATNAFGSSNADSNTVTPTSAFTGLLDTYSGAAVAYSLRKLSSTYSGSAIRVRRSSDNTEQDFGFVANVLDTASLLTFVGAGDGFVTTWYDQSGNGLNVTNTTANNQPQIVSSGSVLMQNSKPTMLYDGSNDSLFRANTNIFRNKNYGVVFTANRFIATPVTNSRAIVYVSNSLGGTRYSNGKTISSNYNLAARRLDGDSAQVIATTTTYNNTNLFLTTGIVDWGNTDAYLFINNNIQVSNTNFLTAGNTDNTQSYLSISSAEGTAFANAHISEVVIYESSQNVNGINTNLNTFYSAY